MNGVQIFENKYFSSVRTMLIDGKPYFCGIDIANALGYAKPRNALSNHCKGVTKTVTPSNGGNQQTAFIPEGDVYRLIIRSKLPNADKFERWIFDEVLPQIRQTGGYIPTNSKDDELTIMAKAHQILEKTLSQKDNLISVLQPKADVYDTVMDSDGTFSINQLAKLVGIGEYKLFEFMRNHKILFYQGHDNVPYERFRSGGYFKVIDTVAPDGVAHSVTRVTQKGVDYMVKLLRKYEVI